METCMLLKTEVSFLASLAIFHIQPVASLVKLLTLGSLTFSYLAATSERHRLRHGTGAAAYVDISSVTRRFMSVSPKPTTV